MNKEQLTKLVAEKFDAAFKAGDHPKKFYVTENGRGVVDGGDLYNAVLKDALAVVKVALVDIIDEAINAKTQAPAESKSEKVSAAKNPAPTREKKK